MIGARRRWMKKAGRLATTTTATAGPAGGRRSRWAALPWTTGGIDRFSTAVAAKAVAPTRTDAATRDALKLRDMLLTLTPQLVLFVGWQPSRRHLWSGS